MIFCLNHSLSTITIGLNLRLSGGSSLNEGRLEVYHNGEWGVICQEDNIWGNILAFVSNPCERGWNQRVE